MERETLSKRLEKRSKMRYLIILAILISACEPDIVEINLFWQDENGNYSSCQTSGVDQMAYTTYYWDYDDDYYYNEYYYSDYYDDYYWDSESSKIVHCQDKIILDVTFEDDYSVVVSGYYNSGRGKTIGWMGECYRQYPGVDEYSRYDCLIPRIY